MAVFKNEPDKAIKNLADALRPRVNPANYLLDTPSADYKALDACGEENIIDVVNWGIFNPMGPTFYTLALVRSVLTKEYFIFWYSNNPRGYMRLIFGLVPGEVVNRRESLSFSLVSLFKRYGGEISGNYPSYVQIAANSPLPPQDVKPMFIAAVKTANPPDLDKICQSYIDYRGRPWERTAAELKAYFESISSGSKERPVPLTPALLDKWWGLVSDPYHAEVEISNMPQAWQGSIAFGSSLLAGTGETITSHSQEAIINAGNYFNQGNSYAKIQAFEPAIEQYSKAIELNPDYTEAYLARGEVYAELEEFEQAVLDFNRAIELNPTSYAGYYNRGCIFSMLNEHRQAIEDFTAAIKLNPTSEKAYNNRGNIYARLEEEELAVRDYNRAIEINPGVVDFYFNRANAKFNLAKYDLAIVDYSKALELDPGMAKAYLYRCLAYKQSGEVAKARADYARAVKLNPDFARMGNF